jgi:hypothetical protein
MGSKNKSPAKARLLPDLNVIRESGLSPDYIIANAHILSTGCAVDILEAVGKI